MEEIFKVVGVWPKFEIVNLCYVCGNCFLNIDSKNYRYYSSLFAEAVCSSSLNPCLKKKHHYVIQATIDSPQLGHCNPKIRLPDTQRAHFLKIKSWKTVSFHDFIKEQNLLSWSRNRICFLMMVQVIQGYFQNIFKR